ncbi:MAG: hypothetical protein AKCLJLPJ_00466 [Fimbriimonadales bacterium]|nr:hypothetical protein [Fimbriimonadales bacterium]
MLLCPAIAAVTFAEVIAAHAKLVDCAVSISVRAKTSSGSTSFGASVWRTPDGRFAVDVRLAGWKPSEPPTWKFVGKPGSLIIFQPSTNRYRSLVANSDVGALGLLQGAESVLDPVVTLFLEPATGLPRLIAGVGSPQMRFIGTAQGELVFRGQTAGQGSPTTLTIRASSKTKLASRITLESADSQMDWFINPSATSSKSAVVFTLPPAAKRVTNFGPDARPITYRGRALELIRNSQAKYADLSSLHFETRSFLFASGSESRRRSTCHFEANGRVLVRGTSPSGQEFEYVWERDKLTVVLHAAKLVRTGACPRHRLLQMLAATGVEIDPFLAQFVRDGDPWVQLLLDGGTVDSSARGTNALLTITTTSGLVLRVTLDSDGLITRMERSSEASSFAETVLIEYSRAAIPDSEWRIQIPPNYEVKPLSGN